MIYLDRFFRSFVLGNKLIKDSELKLLLEKQESLLKELLDFSQRQFAQSDAGSPGRTIVTKRQML